MFSSVVKAARWACPSVYDDIAELSQYTETYDNFADINIFRALSFYVTGEPITRSGQPTAFRAPPYGYESQFTLHRR
jgi:hypothetical protein